MITRSFSLLVFFSSLIAFFSGCEGDEGRWGFDVANLSDQTFSQVTLKFDGSSMDIGESHPGGFGGAGLPGPMPKSVELVLTDEAGTKHTISIKVPARDKDTPAKAPIVFIVKRPDKAFASFRDPRLGPVTEPATQPDADGGK